MRKIFTFLILAALLTGALPILSENAGAATNSIFSDADLDGYLTGRGGNYNNARAAADSADNTSNIGKVGNWYDVAGVARYYVYRTFISFDTSTLPATATIQSATINLKLNACLASDYDFDVKTYNVDYGASLDTGDWNANGTGTYEGVLMNSAFAITGTWYSMSVSTTLINTSGTTQYELISSQEASTPSNTNTADFEMSDNTGTSNDPYMSIVTTETDGATVIYNYTVAGNTNRTVHIYSAEIIEYNNTHDRYEYRFQSLNQSWLNWSLDSSFSYLSISPYASVTDYGNGIFNITSTFDDAYYSIWFMKEKASVKTTLHIALYHATLGEGFFWEKWKIVINSGSTYDNSNASRIWNPDYKVDYGSTYTVAVLDYFDNEIVNQTVSANALNQDILIAVPVYQFNLKSFRTDTTAYAIYFNASGTPYQGHLPAEEYDELALREGSYMFEFTYLNSASNGTVWTVGNSYFYNLTIDATYTVNIGDSSLDILITKNNGQTTTIDNIYTWVNPAVNIECYELPSAPDEGTRSASGSMSPSSSTRAFRIHPYHNIWATASVNVSGTSGNFYNPSPSSGTTTFTEDTIDIEADWDTNIMLNHTGNGTNFINITHPQKINLLDYTSSENFTLWSNGTVNAQRETRFKNSNVFNWTYYPDENRYYTVLGINNDVGPYDWDNIYWRIMGVNGTIFDYSSEERQPSVYDVNNSVYLENGAHFVTNDMAFEMSWDDLQVGTWRSFALQYYTPNETHNPTAIITLYPEGRDAETLAETYWYGHATYANPNENTFEGQLIIKLSGLEGEIDADSIAVIDTTLGRQLGEDDFAYSGNSIIISPGGIAGGVASGSSREFKVLWQYSDTDAADSGMFEAWFSIGNVSMSWHTALLLAAVIMGFYAFFFAGDRSYRGYALKSTLLEFSAILVMIWALLWVLHAQGVVN